MVKPDDWKKLKRHELADWVNRLRTWQRAQSMTPLQEETFYRSEIEPLLTRREELKTQWINTHTCCS
jgi:hypothetical protein